MRKALAALTAADPDLAAARAVAGLLPDRRRAPGFETLMLLIVEQQVSLASARAIWGRVSAGLGEVTPEAVLAQRDAALGQWGLSRPKIRYCKVLADAVLSRSLPLRELAEMDDAAALAALTAIPGIGRWTAETYLLFALERTDIFPAGDVALQTAAMQIKGLPRRPSVAEMDALAEIWRPFRGAAAQLLWRHYGVARGRVTPIPVTVHEADGAAARQAGP